MDWLKPDLREASTAAASYTELGFRVIPLHGVYPTSGKCRCEDIDCKPRDAGKHEPTAQDGKWKDGKVFEPHDFQRGDNIAIAMGPWRDDKWLVCLDVDGATDAQRFFKTKLPETLTAKTPRGAHFIFSVPAFEPLGNFVDVFKTKERGPSLDLRYARGRIVVAPSRGSTGVYEWTNWREPAELPQEVRRAIRTERVRRGLPTHSRWEREGKSP